MKRVFKILVLILMLTFYHLGLSFAANVIVPATTDAACIGANCATANTSTGMEGLGPFFDVFSPSTLLLFGLGLIALSVVGRKIVRAK